MASIHYQYFLKHFFALFLFIFLFSALFASVYAQNPNLPSQQGGNTNSKSDTTTTKTKKDSINYGANTVTYLFEQDIYYNRDTKISPKILKDTTIKMKGIRYADTLIDNIHRRASAIHIHNNTYQDLGNYGTAAQSIFYVAPTEIGTRLGHNVYDAYLWQPQNVKYYNSFSPYTELDVMLGGVGRSKVNVTLARNIRINWNIGITYRRVESSKVFGRNTRRNDSHVSGQTYGFFTRYNSINNRYKVLVNFSAYDHTVNENGGYATLIPAQRSTRDTLQTLDSLFKYDFAQWRYRAITVNEPIKATQTRTLLRIYQQYALFDSSKQEYLQAFHIGEYTRQKNNYTDNDFQDNWRTTIGSNTFFSGIYPSRVYFDTAAIFSPPSISSNEVEVIKAPFYRTTFTQIDNKVGIKGRANKLDYRAYLRLRNYQMRHDFITPADFANPNTGDVLRFNAATSTRDTLRNQVFVGGSLHYQFSDSAYLDVEAEHLLAKDFRLKAEYTNKFLTAGHEQTFYTPTLVQQRLYGTFFRWNNSFNNIYSVRTYGQLNLKLPFATLQPNVSFTNISNYVYYDQRATPTQTADNISMLQVGLNANASWTYWRLKTNLLYSKNLGANLIRMPEFFVNAQLYYEKMFFKGALFGQLGLDVHYKSAFYANAYMTPLQQFHLQDRFTTDNYVVTDVFFNFKITKALLFMKVNNVLQGLIKQGYFNTPVYMAQPRSFELGVNWLFFD